LSTRRKSEIKSQPMKLVRNKIGLTISKREEKSEKIFKTKE